MNGSLANVKVNSLYLYVSTAMWSNGNSRGSCPLDPGSIPGIAILSIPIIILNL